MTIEEEIIMVAESLADKTVNPNNRGCNLWQWKKADYLVAIKGWIAHKVMDLPQDNNPVGMKLPKEPFK